MTTKHLDKTSEKSRLSGEFDFDYWRKLAKTNPDAFETAREREINAYIDSLKDVDAQERMRRLQWRVEMERKRSRTPIEAAIKIYDMMWESVGRNFEAIQELADQFRPEQERQSAGKKPQAKVLKFDKNAETSAAEG